MLITKYLLGISAYLLSQQDHLENMWLNVWHIYSFSAFMVCSLTERKSFGDSLLENLFVVIIKRKIDIS